MEVTNGKGSIKTNSEVEKNYIEKPLLKVAVKIERESDDVTESEIDSLYADHVIKEEMVIGPEVFHKAVYNSSSCSKDAPLLEIPKLDVKTNKKDPQKQTNVIGTEVEITVSDEDAPLHKKPRLQKKKETTEREENTICDTEEGFAPNVDSKINALTDIQTKQNRQIKRVRSLLRHMTIHTGEKPFSCTMCEYRCSIKSTLRIHMRIHTGEKPFSCGVCEYRCSQKSSLRSHKKIHIGDKPFSCTECGYRSTQKIHLLTHMKIHTGEKPFSCTVCEYRFAHKVSLTRHMTIHTGEKPFSCSVCAYRCAVKSNLTMHMNIHTGEKPFFCPVCEYRCAHKSSLSRHMMIHKGDKPLFVSVQMR